VKAVRPSEDEERGDELLDANKEILKLRAELRRVQEERDTLKNPRRTAQGSASKAHLHPRASRSVSGAEDVPDPRGRIK
jgi:transposase